MADQKYWDEKDLRMSLGMCFKQACDDMKGNNLDTKETQEEIMKKTIIYYKLFETIVSGVIKGKEKERQEEKITSEEIKTSKIDLSKLNLKVK